MTKTKILQGHLESAKKRRERLSREIAKEVDSLTSEQLEQEWESFSQTIKTKTEHQQKAILALLLIGLRTTDNQGGM